jgi:hypothetical protein
MAFAETWRAIHDHVNAETTVPNWSVAGRVRVSSFTIASIGPDHVVIRPPHPARPQLVPRQDFEKTYELWSEYVMGNIPRGRLRDASRFSTYVISALHFVETKCGGALP